MDAYTGFAGVYDLLMDNVPYEEWGAFVVSELKKYGIADGLVLDLGCGTGTMTELLAQAGYDMIGVDASCDMLNIAMEKREHSGHDILYLEQDMREFELYGTVRAAVSLCNSLNYLLETAELTQVFRLVNNYLDPGGIFVCDIDTAYKYEEIGDSVIAETREECCFIWDNTWHEEEKINEYDLDFFIRAADGRYDRCVETHYQRGFAPEEVAKAAADAGMELLGMIDADTGGEPGGRTERLYVTLREKGKEGFYGYK
ncbi:MAG: class I SAM-dependent methyltransferase [Lachnospiraceae bacterium]|nr:class I SAM-dependent methyltransferase [Lachnospiraceae bacterium]